MPLPQDYFIVSNDRVYRFDKSGKFLTFIGNKGQGPGEYVSISDLQIDSDNKIVFVLDYFGRKILKYNFDGYNVGSCKLIDDYAFNTFYYYNRDLYLTSAYNAVTPDLVVTDTQSGDIRKVSFRERLMGDSEGYIGSTFLYELDNSLYLYHYFNDTIYKVSDGKLIPSYVLDIGSLKFNYEEADINNLTLSGTRMQVMNFFETDKAIFISYMLSEFKGKKYRNFMAMYDKMNRKIYPSISFYVDKYPMFLCAPGMRLFSTTDSNSFIAVFQASDVKHLPNIGNIEDNNPIIVKFMSK